MVRSIHIGVLVLFYCYAATALNTLEVKRQAAYYPKNIDEYYISDFAFVRERNKRATKAVAGILRGMKAVKTLLSDARPAPPESIFRRDFVKQGGINDAMEDFYSVQPKNVRFLERQNVVIGQAGDRTLLLKGSATETATKVPSLMIYKTEDANMPVAYYDVIKYMPD